MSAFALAPRIRTIVELAKSCICYHPVEVSTMPAVPFKDSAGFPPEPVFFDGDVNDRRMKPSKGDLVDALASAAAKSSSA